MDMKNGRVVQPEERMTDEQWAKTAFTDVTEPALPSPVEGVSDEEFARHIAEHIDGQVREGWELVREAAVATLAENPDDETAQAQLLAYKQFKRKPAFVIGGRPKEATERVGVWARGSDGEFYIRITKCEVGDKIWVKASGGTKRRYALTEKIAHNLYRGRGLGSGE